jgi:hypothetical protein
MVQEETWHIDMLLSYKKDLNMNGFYIGFIGHHVLVLLIFLRVRSVIVFDASLTFPVSDKSGCSNSKDNPKFVWTMVEIWLFLNMSISI